MTGLDPFRTRAHVADFDAIAAGYAARSAMTRACLPSGLDVPYGSHPDEKLDLFFPTAAAATRPLHLFVHGGYWRANVKADYAFLAEPIVAAGAIAAIMDYSLMPGARLARLVDQIRRAAAWLVSNAESFGGDPLALSASGQSAGAHLVSYLGARGPHEEAFPATPVRSLLLVSGIYDLAPIPGSFLQPEIGLTAEEVAHWSPIGATPVAGPHRTLAVGADETAPFHAQQRQLAEALAGVGPPTEVVLPGLNHMSILTEMGTPGTPMAALLAKTVERSRR